MTLVILSFAAGVLFLQLQPELPGNAWYFVCASFPLLLSRRVAWRLPAAFAIGFCWALGMAQLKLGDRLAPELEGRDIEVVGVVSGLPAAGERGVRFTFDPEAVAKPEGAKLPGRILLSWYRSALHEDMPSILAAEIRPGQRWRLTVRLRRPHGNSNPHGFDYEAWLLERGVGATGYVRSVKKAFPEKTGERNNFSDRIESFRDTVRGRFKRVLGETPASGILAALAVGDQRAIPAEEWRLFNREVAITQ